jgi:hypothetical protein
MSEREMKSFSKNSMREESENEESKCWELKKDILRKK